MDTVLENCCRKGSDCQHCGSSTCFLCCLQTKAFYLFSFSNGTLQTCQPHLILSLSFSLLFSSSLLLPQLSASAKEEGFGDPSDPNLTWDRWSSLSSSLHPPLLFRPLLPSFNDVFFAGREETNERTKQLSLMPGGWGGWNGLLCFWEPQYPCEHLFVCGVNISVKRRGHTDQLLRTT